MSWMFKLVGNTGPAIETDAAFKAARVSVRPSEVTGWLSVGARSGAMTGAAVGGFVYSFRNIGANPVLVRRVGVGFICTTGFTAGQEMIFGLNVARAFTASDSGGTAIALTGNNGKHRTSLATLTSVDCRIAATAHFTGGTKTSDTNDLAQVAGWAATTTPGTIIAPSLNNLLSHDTGDYPLVLAQNEGFNIINRIAMGAGGVGAMYVNIEVAEATSY